MGKHIAGEPDRLSGAVVRKGARRDRPSPDRAVEGVLFPVMDDLSLIAADDQLLDSIAAGKTDFGDLFGASPQFTSGYDGAVYSAYLGGPIAPLLANWRSEVVDPPLRLLPPLEVPKRTMYGPVSGPPRRSLRPILGVATAICALLLGSAAVGAHSAAPGDALWPLTQVLYAEHADSVQARLAASSSMSSARAALSSGNAIKASVALTAASDEVQRVAVTDGKEKLQADLNSLWIDVSRIDVSDSASSQTETRNVPVPVPPPTTGEIDTPTGASTISSTGAASSSAASSSVARSSTVPVSSRLIVPPSTSLTTPSVAPIVTPPVASTGASSSTSTPVTATTATTATTAPVSTAPVSTDPVSAAPVSTASATMVPGSSTRGTATSTGASTTSVMPTPTPTTSTATSTTSIPTPTTSTPTTSTVDSADAPQVTGTSVVSSDTGR
jgi:hypothetical protein